MLNMTESEFSNIIRKAGLDYNSTSSTSNSECSFFVRIFNSKAEVLNRKGVSIGNMHLLKAEVFTNVVVDLVKLSQVQYA